MAVYKIFPTKDATIYSLYPSRNTGLDEIIESSTSVINASVLPQTSRFLVQFDSTEINDIINNKIRGNKTAYSRINLLKRAFLTESALSEFFLAPLLEKILLITIYSQF